MSGLEEWSSPRRSSAGSEGGDTGFGLRHAAAEHFRALPWTTRSRRVATYTVTGGAGFIGSHLVDELLRRGHAVRVVDDLSTGRRENLPTSARLEVIEGDVADPAVARRAAAGAAIVLHQAAIPSVPRSVENPVASHHANVDGTLQ